MLDVKKCSTCCVFVPNQIVDHDSAEPIIRTFMREKKGSALYNFMRLVLMLKHDNSYLNRLWGNYKLLTEAELKKKEMEVDNLETKVSLRHMQDLIAKTRMEIKIDIKGMDLIGVGEESDTFLEKLHLTLKNQVKDQVFMRTRYAAEMQHLADYIQYYLNHIIKNAVNGIRKSMNRSTKIVSGRKERGIFETLTFNLKLGFANWTEVDSFEKENKFVKRLRQSIYKEGVSQLIFQDLTKNEKTLIATKMFVENKEVTSLINTMLLSEHVKRTITLEVSYSPQMQMYVLEFFVAPFGKTTETSGRILLDRIDFGEEEIFDLRYISKMNELKNPVPAQPQASNQKDNLIPKTRIITFKRKELLDLLAKAEKRALIYQMIDYLEDIAK